MNNMLLRRRAASKYGIELWGAIKGGFKTSLLNDTPIAGKHHFLIAVSSLNTFWESYTISSTASNTGYIVQRMTGPIIRFNCGTKDSWLQHTVPLYAENIYDVVFDNGTIVVNRGISISEYTTVGTYSKYTTKPTVQMGNLMVNSNALLLQYDTYDLNNNLIHSVVPCKKGDDVGVYDLVTHQFEQCGTFVVDTPDGIFDYFGFVRP